MKIAVIRRKYTGIGGAELYAERLITHLAARGHEVHLFAESWPNPPAGVRWHAIPHSGTRAERPVRFAEAVREAIGADSFDCRFGLERSFKQDVYRAGDGVFKVWLEERRRFAPLWRRWLVGRSRFDRSMMAVEAQTFDPANTRHIIVNSNVVKNEILRNFDFPSERIHLIRNGVDLNRFKPGDQAVARARFGLKPEDYVLLFVGSGWERKNLKFITNWILPALEKSIPQVKLLVAGRGNPWGYRSRNVVFAGPQSDVEVAYQAADLFVFFPIYEPGANVCYESLACGIPVVTNAQNGGGEIVTPGQNGSITAAANDLDGAISAILHWHQRRGKPIEVDRAALSIERNVEETEILLTKAVSVPAGAR